jgi:hypothetical protein
LRLREIAEKTARAWDTYEKGELHPEQILVEDTKPAIQALETRRTATTVEDLKLVTSRYPLFPNPGNGVVESKCELGQTFDSMVCFPCPLNAKLTDLGWLYSSNYDEKDLR